MKTGICKTSSSNQRRSLPFGRRALNIDRDDESRFLYLVFLPNASNIAQVSVTIARSSQVS